MVVFYLWQLLCRFLDLRRIFRNLLELTVKVIFVIILLHWSSQSLGKTVLRGHEGMSFPTTWLGSYPLYFHLRNFLVIIIIIRRMNLLSKCIQNELFRFWWRFSFLYGDLDWRLFDFFILTTKIVLSGGGERSLPRYQLSSTVLQLLECDRIWLVTKTCNFKQV